MLGQKHPEAVGYTPLNLYKSSYAAIKYCWSVCCESVSEVLAVFEQFQITHIGVV